MNTYYTELSFNDYCRRTCKFASQVILRNLGLSDIGTNRLASAPEKTARFECREGGK